MFFGLMEHNNMETFGNWHWIQRVHIGSGSGNVRLKCFKAQKLGVFKVGHKLMVWFIDKDTKQKEILYSNDDFKWP